MDRDTLLSQAALYATKQISFVHVLILQTYGSTSRRSASLLLASDGSSWGTVGGGELEAQALAHAQKILQEEILLSEQTIEVQEGMGSVHLLFLLHTATDLHTDYYRVLADWEDTDRYCTLAVQIEPALALFGVDEAGNTVGNPSTVAVAHAQSVLKTKQPRFIEADGFRCYYSLPVQKTRLLLVGGGHVNQAIASLASYLGLQTIVVETRPSFATEALFPHARERIVKPTLKEALSSLTLDSDTFAVVASHLLDMEAVALLLTKEVAYLGVLGSQHKARALYERFASAAALYVPMGVDIGAESPEEIAISVIAEILAVKHNRNAGLLRTTLPLCETDEN